MVVGSRAGAGKRDWMRMPGRERFWMVLPVPPEEAGGWDPGPGWELGPEPLAARGPLSLYEVRPAARRADPAP